MLWKCPKSVGKGIESAHEWTTRGTCSYCDSLAPDVFMERVRRGELLVPTDKDSKVYIGSQEDKFYFAHLDMEQRLEFVRMFNAKQLRFYGDGKFSVYPSFFEFVKS